MESRDFYEKRMKENPKIGIDQLMNEYAKHIIEINFYNGQPSEFNKLTTAQLKRMNKAVNTCVEWVNS